MANKAHGEIKELYGQYGSIKIIKQMVARIYRVNLEGKHCKNDLCCQTWGQNTS